MSIPFTVQEQQNNNWFRPKYRLGILCGMTKFDAVCTLKKKSNRQGSTQSEPEYELKQSLPNLDTAKYDCEIMRDCLLKYEFMDEDITNLYERDPSSKEVCEAFENISSRLRKSKKRKPIEKYLIFFLFATHGVLKDGK